MTTKEMVDAMQAKGYWTSPGGKTPDRTLYSAILREIVLKKADKGHEKAMVGRSEGAPILTLGTDDIYAAYERLRERGVRFVGEPYRYAWGVGALLLDQDGSPILLQQDSGER